METRTTEPDTRPHRFTVGKFDCTLVSDGTFAYPHPAQFFFADAPPDGLERAMAEWNRQPDQWDEYVSP